jgi:hypothetical protein
MECLPVPIKKKQSRKLLTKMADKKTALQADPKPEVMKMAKEIRSKANLMTDTEREDAFRHGMQLIYGGPGHVAAKTGRT